MSGSLFIGRDVVVKDSVEYGWQVISRAEYERMRKHDHAGPDGNNGAVWVLTMDETGATVLFKGVSVVEA